MFFLDGQELGLNISQSLRDFFFRGWNTSSHDFMAYRSCSSPKAHALSVYDICLFNVC